MEMPAERQRTPRGSLNRELVVRAALDLMREESGKPLTMQRVADSLDTRAMSLYTHVGSRSDLVAAAEDLAFGGWILEVSEDLGWEHSVRQWCVSLRDCMRTYPQLVSEIVSNGRTQPVFLHNLAQVIRCLRSAGIEGRALGDLIRWIPQTVLGAIVLELSRPSDLVSVNDEAAAMYASLGDLEPEEREEVLAVLPYLAEQSLDDLFEYTVERIIDGIRRLETEASQK